MKEAGLNNLVIFLSFSYLKGPDYVEGMVNEQRLKMLDEILAICIENDIHLTIQCSQKTGFTGDSNFETGSINEPQNEAEIAEFAEFWEINMVTYPTYFNYPCLGFNSTFACTR